MKEAEWLSSTNPARMLDWLLGQDVAPPVGVLPGDRRVPSERKLGLLKEVWDSALCGGVRWCMGYISDAPFSLRAQCLGVELNITTEYKPIAAALLREIVGNPFRPVPRLRKPAGCGVQAQDLECASCSRKLYGMRVEDVCPYPSPDWLTPTVLALAHAAYDEHQDDGTLDPDRLAVLSDALEEAGCEDQDILGHLRTPGPHVRGCWCLDLVLGKE